jgi:DNA-binding LytR/AlgR family response regulator
MKCMILDDEPLARKQIQAYVERTPFLTMGCSVGDSLRALEAFYETEPDLLFVDINMPELNGMDFVKLLKNPCLVIFTTAYSDYALESYRVDAVDYLLKPVSYPDFLRSANKARQLYELKNLPEIAVKSTEEYLFVKSDSSLVRIKYADIDYIEGMREYIRIFLSNGTKVMSLLSMKVLEERLPRDMFMRVHRSYIVNLNKITVIERHRIVFNKRIVPVGEQYKDALEQHIKKNFFGR